MGLSSYEIAVNKAKAGKVEADALKKIQQEKASQRADLESRLEIIRNEEKTKKHFKETYNDSLINCETCHNLISIRAVTCPKCGGSVLENCSICKEKIPKNSNKCPSCGDPKPFENQTNFPEKSFQKDNDTTQPRISSNYKPATLTKRKEQSINLVWFKFWIFFLLPIFSLINSIYLVSSLKDWQARMPLSILCLAISFGLYFRKNWAWQINWGIVGIAWITVPLYFNVFSYKSPVNLLISLLIAICWIWPNTLYWKKIRVIMR